MKNIETRYMMLTVGRAGSSLLAAIIADAGGEFGFPPPEKWNPGAGEMEHPTAMKITQLFQRSLEIEKGRRFFFFYKWLYAVSRSRGKKLLKKVLKESHFLKCERMDLFIQHVPKAGYMPQLIVPYRRFASSARSMYIMTGVRYPEMVENYCEVNSSALLMLDAFGGCAVSYEELTDHSETVWADAISTVTGLSAVALLNARNSRVKKKNGKVDTPLVDLEDVKTSQLFDRLYKLKGLAIPPSPHVSRKIKV